MLTTSSFTSGFTVRPSQLREQQVLLSDFSQVSWPFLSLFPFQYTAELLCCIRLTFILSFYMELQNYNDFRPSSEVFSGFKNKTMKHPAVVLYVKSWTHYKDLHSNLLTVLTVLPSFCHCTGSRTAPSPNTQMFSLSAQLDHREEFIKLLYRVLIQQGTE